MDFDTYYEKIWKDRWPTLKAALLQETHSVARINPFTKASALPDGAWPLPGIPAAYASRAPFPPPTGSPSAYYLMDAASILAAQALEVQPGDRVLDLCAAPGGKTLILAEALGSEGRLIANDLSRDRRERLKLVLQSYLSKDRLSQVTIAGKPAEKWCLHEKSTYDRILADVPCSSERHVLQDPKALKQWTPARPKQLAQRQHAILASAVQALKPGGRVVYSTCSICPLENDEVITSILKKKKHPVRVIRHEFPMGEPTEHGWAILPDKTGWGPIYIALLERVSSI